MQYPARARTASAEPLGSHREWISSREALRLIMAVYASHDFLEYDSDAIHQWVARERATDAILRRLTEGSLVARPMSFRYTLGSLDDGNERLFELHEPEGTIDPNFWRTLRRLGTAATADWIAGDFSFDDRDAGIYATGYADGVLFDLSGLPALGATHAKPSRKAGGAPCKWDWDGAFLHLAALAHHTADGLYRDDGSDPNQSDIAKHLQAWFVDTCDKAPEDSQLRDYGKRFETELNALKFRDSNK